jgi:trk system potassium uptake protein
VCNKLDLPAINYLFEFEKQPSRTVFILGGGRVGEALAVKLAGLEARVKLIEADPALCLRLAEDLEEIAVLNTDGMDVETLKHEGIADCDVYVSTTSNEETNILCGLLAKSYGAKRAIALVDRHELVTLAPSLGIDACISPRLATASAVLKYVRPSSVTSVALIERSNAEVLEVIVPAAGNLIGRALKDLDMPSGAIIGVIVRGNQVVIPGGEDRLQPDDHVIVFALPEAIARVERFFAR